MTMQIPRRLWLPSKSPPHLFIPNRFAFQYTDFDRKSNRQIAFRKLSSKVSPGVMQQSSFCAAKIAPPAKARLMTVRIIFGKL
jgi:hypothetical protein